MRVQLFTGVTLAVVLAISSPASAESPWQPSSTGNAALKWELGYLALSAVDAAQTIDCLNRGICKEANPLFGKHPSTAKLILAKATGGALHYALFTRIRQRDEKMALRVAQMSCAMQGGIVALNARFTF